MLFFRTEETAFRGRSKNERVAKIISSLRGSFKWKDILSYTQLPKATYMYWQERYIQYYNEQRIKEKLGWKSPVQYRLSLQAA